MTDGRQRRFVGIWTNNKGETAALALILIAIRQAGRKPRHLTSGTGC